VRRGLREEIRKRNEERGTKREEGGESNDWKRRLD
jgi:hypothetical protein